MAATTTKPAPASRRRAKRPLGMVRYFLFYGCLTLIALVFIGLDLIAFFGAFKSEANLFATSPWAPPHSLYLGNFLHDPVRDHFLDHLGDTALVTVALTAGQVTFGVLAAYAFARLEFPGRDALFYLYLATLMVPNVVTLVPLYTMMREFHLTNTYWAIFLPYVLGIPYTDPPDAAVLHVAAGGRLRGRPAGRLLRVADPDPDRDPDGKAHHHHRDAYRVRLRLGEIPAGR